MSVKEEAASKERLLKSHEFPVASKSCAGGKNGPAAPIGALFYNSMPPTVPNYGSITNHGVLLPVAINEAGEIRVRIPSSSKNNNALRRVGMSKSELMKYVTDPFWVRVRTTLHALFWILWFSMAIGSVVIVMAAPRCAKPPKLAWWQKATVYQIYIDSFMDSDGDGRGDINGLASKLDYLEQLGVDTLVLSRIHPTPLPVKDDEDLELYMDVDESVGSLEEFEKLLKDVESRDLKVVLDLEFDSSNIEALPSETGGTGQQQNGNETLQYTVLLFKPWEAEAFSSQKPESEEGKRNSTLKIEEKLLEILSFWLEKGVAGFRLVVQTENNSSLPSPAATTPRKPKAAIENNCIEWLSTRDLPDSILYQWQELLKDYSNKTGIDRVLLTGACGNIVSPDHYANIPVKFDFLKINRNATVKDLYNILGQTETSSLPETWPNWVLGDYNTPRLATRFGSELLDGIHMAVLLARGTPVIVYGDEIGMEDIGLTFNTSIWGSVSPMQWSNDVMAGFTEANFSWLPVNKNYRDVNVEVELAKESSHLNVFRSLAKLRQKLAVKRGLQEFPLVTENVFSMLRYFKGQPGYLVVLNWGEDVAQLNFRGTSKYLPEMAEVEVHGTSTAEDNRLEPKKRVSLENLIVGPKESVVLTFASPVI